MRASYCMNLKLHSQTHMFFLQNVCSHHQTVPQTKKSDFSPCHPAILREMQKHREGVPFLWWGASSSSTPSCTKLQMYSASWYSARFSSLHYCQPLVTVSVIELGWHEQGWITLIYSIPTSPFMTATQGREDDLFWVMWQFRPENVIWSSVDE